MNDHPEQSGRDERVDCVIEEADRQEAEDERPGRCARTRNPDAAA